MPNGHDPGPRGRHCEHCNAWMADAGQSGFICPTWGCANAWAGTGARQSAPVSEPLVQQRFLDDPLTVARELGAIGDMVPVATMNLSPVARHGLLSNGDGFIDWAGPNDRVIVPLVRNRISHSRPLGPDPQLEPDGSTSWAHG